jgi:hypothetical protein
MQAKVNWSNITKHTNLRNTPNTQGSADPRDVSPSPARWAPSMPTDNQKSKLKIHTHQNGILWNGHASATAQLEPEQLWVTNFPLGRSTATPDVHSSCSQTRVLEPRERTLQEGSPNHLAPSPTLCTATLAAVGRQPWTGRGSLDASRKIEKGSFRPRDQVPEPASLKNSVNGSEAHRIMKVCWFPKKITRWFY